jgi:peptidoglycan hydrolase-like protein with peptidoglycan-binding domain
MSAMKVLVTTAACAAAAILAATAAFAQSDPTPLPFGSPGHHFAPNLAQIYITDIQTLLAARGYYAGPLNGQITPATQAAIAAYQRDIGLPPTGIADQGLTNILHFGPKVMAAAPAAPTPPPPDEAPPQPQPLMQQPLAPPPLAPDPVQLSVRELQARMTAKGYYNGPLDGALGPQTVEAIQTYQRKSGLLSTATVPAAAVPAAPPPPPAAREAAALPPAAATPPREPFLPKEPPAKESPVVAPSSPESLPVPPPVKAAPRPPVSVTPLPPGKTPPPPAAHTDDAPMMRINHGDAT